MKILNTIIATTFCIILSAHTVYAGSFSEKFRRFVLGPEAEAYSINHEKDVQLDHTAENCLGCHDGTKGTHITTKNSDSPYSVRGFKTVNHPVGMSYDLYALSKPGQYTPKSYLDRNIHLVDGKVTCVSCHKLKSDSVQPLLQVQAAWDRQEECTASHELTVGSTTKDLCVACHNSKF